VTRIVEGVKTAAAALEPATLFGYAFEADDLQMNRRDRPGMFDRSANILLAARPDGSWIGGLANIAIHGTALPADNRLYSADVPGAMVAALERALQGAGAIRPVVLFINGAEGDVAPKEDGVSGMAAVAARFASQAMNALPSRTEISPEWSVLHGQVRLGRARFNLRACVPGSGVLRTLAAIPNLFIGTAFPQRTDIWAVNLGGHLMLTWPGEPITSVGMELKQLGASTGARQTWILGLTNDHLSYFVDPAEYRDEQRHSYEACSSLYGSAGGTKVISAFRTLLGFR
jgi:hypothetical protein